MTVQIDSHGHHRSDALAPEPFAVADSPELAIAMVEDRP